MKDYMIALKDVCYKSEHGLPILQNITLTIERGECMLIAGQSGSGKSTIGSLINGLIPHYYKGDFSSGTVSINGKDTGSMELCEIGRIVGTVFQDPRSQFFMTDTFNEVAFGCTMMQLSREEVTTRTENSFSKLGIEKLRHTSIFNLSSGEKQKIAIASVYAMKPEIIIFDEPSANLDIDSIFDLKNIMQELKREGKTVIVLEHRLFYLKDLFDRMVYLNKGSIAGIFSHKEAMTLSDEERKRMKLRSFHLEMMLQSSKENKENKNQTAAQIDGHSLASDTHQSADFEIKELSFWYGKKNYKHTILSNISLKANCGEIIGIVGANGTGKTTLAKLCAGLLQESTGSILIDGTVFPPKKRLGNIYFVMQDADYQLFASSVNEELLIEKQKKKSSSTGEREAVLSHLGLTDYKDRHPASLSGGEKQRLTVAAALLSDCPVIFFDEPTSGLDWGGMECISSSMAELGRSKKILFIISHDYEFLLSACKRIIYISGGNIKEDFMLTEDTAVKLWDILAQRRN